MLATRSADKEGVAYQQGCGAAVCTAVRAEGRAGRALKLRQLDQVAMESTRQKGMASLSFAPTMTDAASQTEFQC